jgi:hypothetical protein
LILVGPFDFLDEFEALFIVEADRSITEIQPDGASGGNGGGAASSECKTPRRKHNKKPLYYQIQTSG